MNYNLKPIKTANKRTSSVSHSRWDKNNLCKASDASNSLMKAVAKLGETCNDKVWGGGNTKTPTNQNQPSLINKINQ